MITLLKFGLSEKNTKFGKIFHLELDGTYFKWNVFLNVVFFSERPKFIRSAKKSRLISLTSALQACLDFTTDY